MANLGEIATQAGVSIRTVRRVLHGSPSVHPETARRVQAVLAEHACVPNHHARALVGAKTHLVALVVPQLLWHGTNVLIVTLRQQISTLGLRTVFFVSEPEPIEQTVVELRQMRPQAVVLMRVGWHDEYRRLLDDDTHLLWVDVRGELPPDLPADTMGLDRTGAFRVLTGNYSPCLLSC